MVLWERERERERDLYHCIVYDVPKRNKAKARNPGRSSGRIGSDGGLLCRLPTHCDNWNYPQVHSSDRPINWDPPPIFSDLLNVTPCEMLQRIVWGCGRGCVDICRRTCISIYTRRRCVLPDHGSTGLHGVRPVLRTSRLRLSARGPGLVCSVPSQGKSFDKILLRACTWRRWGRKVARSLCVSVSLCQLTDLQALVLHLIMSIRSVGCIACSRVRGVDENAAMSISDGVIHSFNRPGAVQSRAIP